MISKFITKMLTFEVIDFAALLNSEPPLGLVLDPIKGKNPITAVLNLL